MKPKQQKRRTVKTGKTSRKDKREGKHTNPWLGHKIDLVERNNVWGVDLVPVARLDMGNTRLDVHDKGAEINHSAVLFCYPRSLQFTNDSNVVVIRPGARVIKLEVSDIRALYEFATTGYVLHPFYTSLISEKRRKAIMAG